ncbi:hypothetical protein V6N13_133749 [Hibiscus sabdariffa]
MDQREQLGRWVSIFYGFQQFRTVGLGPVEAVVLEAPAMGVLVAKVKALTVMEEEADGPFFRGSRTNELTIVGGRRSRSSLTRLEISQQDIQLDCGHRPWIYLNGVSPCDDN